MLRKASPPYLPGWRPLPVQWTISSRLGGNQEDLAEAVLQENTTPAPRAAHKCIPQLGCLLEVPTPHAVLHSALRPQGHRVKLQILPPGCALHPQCIQPVPGPDTHQSALAVFIWGHSQRPHVEKTGPRTQWWHSDQPPRSWLIAETPG